MKIFQTLFMIVAILLAAVSCSDGDESPKKVVDKNTISAKWLASDAKNGYSSFEFNASGNYIVVQKTLEKTASGSDVSYFGTYKILNETTIELDGLGKLTVSYISDDKLDFVFADKTETEYALSTQRAEEMRTTSRTNLLCRTWLMKTIGGESVEGTVSEGTAFFSAAGTYFMNYPKALDGSHFSAKWRWVGTSNEAKMEYSHLLNFEDAKEIDIVELTETSLKIREKISDVRPESILFELVPVN